MIGWIFKLAGSFFTGPLGRILDTIDKRGDQIVDKERIRSEAITKYIDTMAANQRVAMGFKIFWVAWGTFTMPLATWFALIMIDTQFTFIDWGIPDLPESIRPYADTIFENVFLTGAGGAAAQAIAGAIGRRN